MPHPEKPDQRIWDLDPDPDPAVPRPLVLGAAFLIRDFLADLGLHPLVKTSGNKGKIFNGWMRNGEGPTRVARWCFRARGAAAVSMSVNFRSRDDDG